ncbi:hypothetical protein Ancab_024369 [Ancistrocladus abbreviatus]
MKTQKGSPMGKDYQVSLELLPPPPSLHPPTAAAAKKKTRELPNLSDCHCCNRRINTTNPKQRLRTLNSEWRIILLCKQCYKLVESAQLCSYCLTGPGKTSASAAAEEEGDRFRQCPRCERRVHTDCIAKYSKLAPWCFLPGGGGGGGGAACSCTFFVCIDCWMPKSLENNNFRDHKVCGGRARRDGKTMADSCSPGNSRVSDGHPVKRKSLEVEANEADCVAKKKTAVAIEAKDKAMRKAVVARRAVELAYGALDIVAKKGEGEDMVAGRSSSVVIDDDVQLAFQLHRAMNSSPRISKNMCLLNKRCSDVQGASNHKCSLSSGSSMEGLDGNLVIDLDGLGSQALIQTSSSSKSTNIGSGEDSTMDAESQSCPEQHGVHLNETAREGGERCDSNSGVMQGERCNVERDRYFWKYSRRQSFISGSGSKAVKVWLQHSFEFPGMTSSR